MSWLGKFDDFDQLQSNTCRPTHSTPRKQSFNSSSRDGNEGYGQTAVQDLLPGAPNVSVVGLVIAKEEPREVLSKTFNSNSSSRLALGFVLRDSISSYICGTCWGSDNFIRDLAKNFHINDVIEIYNPQIQTKPDGADKFRPWTPSPYHLNLSEHHSTLKIYQDWDFSNYTTLEHVPIRPDNDFFTLGDIVTNGQGMSGEHVNIQASVKHVGQVREIVTKKGRQTKTCEVKLFDKTCPSFVLNLWDEEIINQAILWNPGEYVICAVDVRVYYDEFRKSMVASAGSKTIFIINPDNKEAHSLYEFAQSQQLGNEPPNSVDSFGQKDPDMSEVKDVLNVRGAKAMEEKISTEPYFCIVYAYLSQFDIDQESVSCIRYRCPKCKQILEDSQQVCLNPPCIDSSTSGQFAVDIYYDIPVTLSDHTGSLSNCRLNSTAAEEMIGLKAQQFLSINCGEKTQHKWKYLLERHKVFLKVQRGRNIGRTFCRILSCSPAEPPEVQSQIERVKYF